LLSKPLLYVLAGVTNAMCCVQLRPKADGVTNEASAPLVGSSRSLLLHSICTKRATILGV